jgi:hypothetical protein
VVLSGCPMRGQTGCRTEARQGARRGPDGVPNRVVDGRIITFKRKNDMFCIRVM